MPPRPVRHPKPQPALLIDASQSLRAVVHGRGGHVTFFRGNASFVVTDLEWEHSAWARDQFLGRGKAADGD